MAKPTQTITWAEDFNYSQGLFPGTPTKLKDPLGASQGAIPGEGIVSQFYNANMNILGQHTQWVVEGSSTPGLNAHIIETDADGISRIASLELGGTTSSDFPLVITKNTGDTSIAADISNDSNGIALRSITTVGTAANLQATDATGKALTASTTTGNVFEATSTSGQILVGTTANGTGCNITTSNVNGNAIFGTISAIGATVNSSGVFGFNQGAGNGLKGYSLQGYPAWLQQPNSTKGAALLFPQNTPSSLDAGALWYNASQEAIGWGYSGGDYHYSWGTPGGFVWGFNHTETPLNVAGNLGGLNTPTDGISCTLQSPLEPKVSNQYVEITVELGILSPYDEGVDIPYHWEVVDVTAGSVIISPNPILGGTYSYNLQGGDMGGIFGINTLSKTFMYQIPAVGPRVFKLRFNLDGAIPFVMDVMYQTIKVRGLFPTAGG